MEDIIEIMWNGDIGLGVWTGYLKGRGFENVYYIHKNGYWHEIPVSSEQEAIQYFNNEINKN